MSFLLFLQCIDDQFCTAEKESKQNFTHNFTDSVSIFVSSTNIGITNN